MKPVLVTGATGFIGQAIIGRLLSDGVPVRALVRRGGPALPGCEMVTGSVLDEDRLGTLTQGTSGVIHLAGRVHRESEAGAAAIRGHDAHVQATRALATQAASAGASRFLFMSTIGVFGAQSVPLHEGLPPRPETAYGRAKLAAERTLQEVAEESGLAVAVLRPPGVYGPGMKGAPLRLFDFIARERFIPVPREPVVRALVHIKNLVAAVAFLWDQLDAGVIRAVVVDPEQLTVEELVRRGARTGKVTPRLVRVPTRVLRTAGMVGDAFTRLGVSAPMTSKDVARLLRPVHIDDGFIRGSLGFRPPLGVDQALAETMAWAQARVGDRRLA